MNRGLPKAAKVVRKPGDFGTQHFQGRNGQRIGQPSPPQTEAEAGLLIVALGRRESKMATSEGPVYSRNSVVRIEQIKGKGPTQEFTIQRLLSTEHAAGWCVATLEDLVLPDLTKAVKACRTTRVPKRIQSALESVLTDFRKELREYRRKSADPSVGSATRVSILPEPGPRKAAA